MTPHENKVDVITPVNILFREGSEFWPLMKIKLMSLPQSTYCSEGVQSRAEVRAIFLNVDKPLAEKSPRPGHSRVTAIHQNTRGLPSFEGYKVTVCEKEKEEEEDKKRNKKKH